jgi:hypothetical protein
LYITLRQLSSSSLALPELAPYQFVLLNLASRALRGFRAHCLMVAEAS